MVEFFVFQEISAYSEAEVYRNSPYRLAAQSSRSDGYTSCRLKAYEFLTSGLLPSTYSDGFRFRHQWRTLVVVAGDGDHPHFSIIDRVRIGHVE